jgi:hypothetical protein
MPKVHKDTVGSRMSERLNPISRTNTSMNRVRPDPFLLAEHEDDGDLAHKSTIDLLPGLPQDANFDTHTQGVEARRIWLENNDFTSYLEGIRIDNNGTIKYPHLPKHITIRSSKEFTPIEQSQISNRISELRIQYRKPIGGRISRKKRKYKKTKLRKSRKNILKKGGATKTENEDYKATMALITSIFPTFETTVNKIKFFSREYLTDLIVSLIGFLEKFANAKGYNNMNNKLQVDSILKPALEEFIAYIKNNTTDVITRTIGTIVSTSNISVDSIFNKEIKADDISKESKTARINVLLSRVPDNQLIPELITHLKVYNEGKYYSGPQILQYEFPKNNLPIQNLDDPTLTKTNIGESKPEQQDEPTLTETNIGESKPEQQEVQIQEVQIQEPEDAQLTAGGKKKSRARNKLYNTHKKMYLRRKTKNNRRY